VEKIIDRREIKEDASSAFVVIPIANWSVSPVHQAVWTMAWRQTVAALTVVRVLQINPAEMPREWLN
jgi:hypothetical protein